MKYDFDHAPDRRGSGSLKWDLIDSPDVLPLWVADMDFKVAPCIQKALSERCEHGIFGYEMQPKAYYDAIIGWQHDRNGLAITRDDIIPVPGVVPALSAVLQALTQPGEQVVTLTPCYNCFFSSIRNSGLTLLESRLRWQEGRFSIDFDDLRQKCAEERVRVMLLCNPHNPSGRLWSEAELKEIAAICEKNGLIVISDEIHSDVRPNGSRFISFATLSEWTAAHTVTLNSPSKAFNLAGLQNAYIICQNRGFYSRIDRRVNINEICDQNVFGVSALIAAYTEGREWLEEVNEVISRNYALLCDCLKENLPGFKAAPLEATYLAFVDCSAAGLSSKALQKKLLKEGLFISAGSQYGQAGEGFVRINLACPKATLEEALRRFVRALRDSGPGPQ